MRFEAHGAPSHKAQKDADAQTEIILADFRHSVGVLDDKRGSRKDNFALMSLELTSRLKKSHQNPAKNAIDFRKLAGCPSTSKGFSKTQDRRVSHGGHANTPLKNFLLESKDFLKNVKLMMTNSKRSPSKNSLAGLDPKNLNSLAMSRDSFGPADLYTRENSRGRRMASPENLKKASIDSFRRLVTEEANGLKTIQFIRAMKQKNQKTSRLPLSRASVESRSGRETPSLAQGQPQTSDLSQTSRKNQQAQ